MEARRSLHRVIRYRALVDHYCISMSPSASPAGGSVDAADAASAAVAASAADCAACVAGVLKASAALGSALTSLLLVGRESDEASDAVASLETASPSVDDTTSVAPRVGEEVAAGTSTLGELVDGPGDAETSIGDDEAGAGESSNWIGESDGTTTMGAPDAAEGDAATGAGDAAGWLPGISTEGDDATSFRESVALGVLASGAVASMIDFSTPTASEAALANSLTLAPSLTAGIAAGSALTADCASTSLELDSAC